MKKRVNYILVLVSALLMVPSWAYAYAPPPASNIWGLFQKPRLTYDLARGLVPEYFKIIQNNTSQATSPEDFNDNPGSRTFGRPINKVLSWSIDNTAGIPKYSLTLKGIQDSDMLVDFEVVIKFKKIESKALEQLFNLSDRGNFPNRCDKNGNSADSGLYLCFRSSTNASIPGQRKSAQYLQIIPYKGIFIEGNVAAGGSASSFSVEPDAIVAANTILNVDSRTQLSGYTISSWPQSVSVNKLIEKAEQTGKKISYNVDDGTNVFRNIFLNTTQSSILQRSDPSSFNNPPEGKLWIYELSNVGTNSLTITGQVNGSGTLVLKNARNINSILVKELKCEQNTRFALISDIPLTINGEGSGISCGMYISSKDITFIGNSPSGVKITGLFATEGNIKLPNINQLQGPYEIYMDTYFADNPAVLTKELLKLTIGGR